MSRLFDFLHKVDTEPRALESVDADASNGTSELRQILSVLDQVPEAPPPASLPARVVESAEVVPVRIQPTARLAVHNDPGGAAADRFRLLRVRLRDLARTHNLKKILVTSPLPRDGKSTVALNLATALAEGGARSVLLIDADLHKSNLEHQLGLKPRPGLAEYLSEHHNPGEFIIRLHPLGWSLLPAGQAPANPSEFLHTAPVAALFESLSARFDWILIDSPPVLPLADAVSLSRHADACLLVARAGQTPRAAVDEAVALLGRKWILGVLLNGVDRIGKGYSGYYRYYTSHRPESQPDVE